MDQKFFRKAALDRMASPEQLDVLMRVTWPTQWLATGTIVVMLAALIAWAFLGAVPDLVDGQGTLFRGERLVDVAATMSGTLVQLRVRTGASVAAGQSIAVIRRDRAGNEELDEDALTIQRTEAAMARSRQELATLQQWKVRQRDLVNQGLKAVRELSDVDREIMAVEREINGNQRDLRALKARQVATTEVRSRTAGRVVEVVKSAGDKVAEDEPLCRLEPLQAAAAQHYCNGDVHAIVYVPAAQAGRVRPGQQARVSLAGVKREEYGYIIGKVNWMSPYPASTADMTEKLKNDQLVRAFMAYGPVFEARVCLDRDPKNTANPFRWSSSRGPKRVIDAGTPATVSIVSEARKPYTYVIPAIRRVTKF